ncbi:MAG TPA: mucoidy inhibitor MuiA family protein, partial [Emticicia sp.]
MKKSFFRGSPFFIVFLLGMRIFVFSQNQVRVEAENQHITVFLNRAQIDAKVKATVQAGTTKLIISNVASTIDPSSVQVGGKGDVVIMGVKFKHNYLGNKKRNVLEDSIRIITTEVQTIDMLIKVADNERNMLMANANIKNEKDGVTPEDLKEMLDFFRTKLTEIGTRQMQLARQAKEANDKLTRLQNQLNSQGGNLNQPAGEIELTVSSKANATLDINLSYVANAAGWSPIYDIRAKDTRSDIALAYRANVFQNTGIDWKNVKLTLSTSNPSEGGTKPELYPQYATVFEPTPNVKTVRYVAPQAGAEAAAAPVPDNIDQDRLATTANFVSTIQTTLAVNFDISMPYSIISGGNPEMVDIQNFNLPASYKYYAVPKYD